MHSCRSGCRHSLALRFGLGLLLAAIGFLSRTETCQAAGGGKQVLPIVGKLNTSGVQVVLDSRWIEGRGYHPVRVEIIPLRAPAIGDRTFRVVIRPNSYDSRSDAVSQIIELEQGSSKAVATILVPQESNWHGLVVEVFEDGGRLGDLSGDYLNWPRAGGMNWHEPTPGVLLIDSQAPTMDQREVLLNTLQSSGIAAVKKLPGVDDVRAPDLRNLLRSFQYSPFYGSYVATDDTSKVHPVEILNELKDNPKGDILPPAELPERWLAYSNCDLIFISLADLQLVKDKHPKVLQALADWNRSGRFLVVYDVGEDFDNLPQLEKILQLAPLPQKDGKVKGWQKAKDYRSSEVLRGMVDDPYAQNPMYAGAPSMPGSGTILQPPDKTKWQIVSRDMNLGQVLAIDGNPFPAHHIQWVWLLNSIRGEAWNPTIRSGASLTQRNDEFWNFLIPGTGQAPVLSFLVFITLFVMLIGPINYYVLNRQGRLYLLLITVPASAILVTGGLFLYAILTDGLGVKTRVRSYTNLDQRSGNIASLSRQAYYASIAPSQGLQFRDDAAVQTYEHRPDEYSNPRGARRLLHWSDDEQQLRSGYISSRTLSQMFVNTAGQTKAKLEIGKVQGDSLSIQNKLEMPLSYVVVCDADGNYFAGEKIPLAGEASLRKITLKEASEELAKRMGNYEPNYPEGYSENMHRSNFRFWGFSRNYWRSGTGTTVFQATSMLERNLYQFSHLSRQPLAPRSYVTLSEIDPAIPLGAAKVKQQLSLHVTEGNY
ncbi:hypothetical protein NA78x_006290 [Anatilimnocola sp. NA78]|uniref:hypothetical protein n=1 Tax=Anatilimnocola sp. NA78 TaxID=3415683 RepID=UPI003CE5AA41